MKDTEPPDYLRPDYRESIWSVSRDDLTWYSILFPVLWIVGAAISSVTIFHQQLQPAEMIRTLVGEVGLVGLSAAILSLVILAVRGGVRRIMPLFDWADRRDAKLRKEGRQEADSTWREWYEQEKANGRRFENPPTPNDMD